MLAARATRHVANWSGFGSGRSLPGRTVRAPGQTRYGSRKVYAAAAAAGALNLHGWNQFNWVRWILKLCSKKMENTWTRGSDKIGGKLLYDCILNQQNNFIQKAILKLQLLKK